MNDRTASFRRVVFGFERSAPDRAALRYASHFARLLRLEMFAMFAENPNIAMLATHPLLREYRFSAQQWRSIEGRGMLRDLESCASIAKQMFEEEVRHIGASHSFEIVQATTADAIRSVSDASDIVVLVEPKTLTDRAIEPFSETISVAIKTPASVLVVPNTIVREQGPVLVIGETNQDRSMTSAELIAEAINEKLEFMPAIDPSSEMPQRPSNWPGERLVVMTRRVGEKLGPLTVASRRRVPVLVLGEPHD